MAFVGASNFSIQGGAYNYVQGDQNITYINQVIQQQNKKTRTVYDEFPDIQRGLVHRIRVLDQRDRLTRWNRRLMCYELEYEVERTICTAEIHGDTSRFTVVSYKGRHAKKAWNKEFRRFSENIDTTKMQLFGINKSNIPLLIFYGELVPLAHFRDEIGWLGQAYACTWALNTVNCEISEVWIDPKQGTLISGPEGTDRNLGDLFFDAEGFPSSAELLQEDACLRYLSRMPLDGTFDTKFINVAFLMSEIKEKLTSVVTHRPGLRSTLTDSIIAVGEEIGWKAFHSCLHSPIVVPDGRTRFLLGDAISLGICLTSVDNVHVWHSQAPSVFHNLGISLNEDLSLYELISPSIELRGLVDNDQVTQQRRLKSSPIYCFLDPPHLFPSLKDGLYVSVITWSSDRTGRTLFSNDFCDYLGLPTVLKVARATTYKSSWSTETYKAINKWQLARGFDPTTTDFARYLGYPIFKVDRSNPVPFEELCPGAHHRFWWVIANLRSRGVTWDAINTDLYLKTAELGLIEHVRQQSDEETMDVDSETTASHFQAVDSVLNRFQWMLESTVATRDANMDVDDCSDRFEELFIASTSDSMEID